MPFKMFTKLMLALCMAFTATTQIYIVTTEPLMDIIDNEQKKKIGRRVRKDSPVHENMLKMLGTSYGSVIEFTVPAKSIFGMFATRSHTWGKKPPTKTFWFDGAISGLSPCSWRTVKVTSEIMSDKTGGEFIVTPCVPHNGKVQYWQVCPVNNDGVKYSFNLAIDILKMSTRSNPTFNK